METARLTYTPVVHFGQRPLLGAATLVAALVALGGCGTDGGGSTDLTSSSLSPLETGTTAAVSTTGAPLCDEVWVGGQTLPADYESCERDGALVEATRHRCEFGLTLVEFDNTFYAVPGKVINEVPDLASSPEYKHALSSCQG
jgi:hypothetical protein